MVHAKQKCGSNNTETLSVGAEHALNQAPEQQFLRKRRNQTAVQEHAHAAALHGRRFHGGRNIHAKGAEQSVQQARQNGKNQLGADKDTQHREKGR